MKSAPWRSLNRQTGDHASAWESESSLSHKSPEVVIAAVFELVPSISSVHIGLIECTVDATPARGARPLQYRLLPAVWVRELPTSRARL